MKVGDRVIVDAAVTGDGIHHRGTITDISELGRSTFVDVMFDEPTWDGWKGTCISNLELIKEDENEAGHS